MMKFNLYLDHFANIERKRISMPKREDTIMRLNRGERPFPLRPEVRAALATAAAASIRDMHQYPSYQEFYARISEGVEFPVDHICVGAGIEEFIRSLMWLHTVGHVSVLWPTCAMYDVYAKAFLVKLHRIKPVPGEPFNVRDLIQQLQQINSATKLLFIPNPGQPVETHFTIVELRLLAEFCNRNDIILAVDEAHWGFGAHSAVRLVHDFDNVIVMRTFSKFFGAASLRVGFTVAQPKLTRILHAVRPSGEIAGPSLLAASVLLDKFDYFVQDALLIKDGRNWLRQRVQTELGLRAWGQYGFSVLIEFASVLEANAVASGLAQRGVFVKADFPPPVEKCMLLACGPQPMMSQFFNHLYTVYKLYKHREQVNVPIPLPQPQE